MFFSSCMSICFHAWHVLNSICSNTNLLFRRLNLDLVPRIDGEIIEGDSTSVVELYQIHVNSSKNITRKKQSTRNSKKHPVVTVEKRMSIYGTMSKRPPVSKAPTSHHLFISFKSFMCNIGEAATLLFALYDARTASYMRYVVVVNCCCLLLFIFWMHGSCKVTFTTLFIFLVKLNNIFNTFPNLPISFKQ